MGTPDFAVPTLSKLVNSQHNVKAIFTQRPKPKNRGMSVDISPVHSAGLENNIDIFTPTTLRDEKIYKQILDIEADCIVVVAYGMIIPENIINSKKYGCINLHPSKLPRFRGAAPLQRTIIAGDTETAICTIQMDKGLDTGDILLSKEISLNPRISFTELHNMAAYIGANLILETLNNIDNIKPTKQSEDGLLYAHKLKKEEGLVNWQKDSAFELDCKIRGMNPWPGVYFLYKGELVKILEASYKNDTSSLPPGTIIDKDISITCLNGILTLISLQRPGKKAISAKDFMNGFKINIGDKL
jgi:methionyl-tRNA formyltransferase